MLSTQQLMVKIKQNNNAKNLMIIAWLFVTGGAVFFNMRDEPFTTVFFLALGSISTLVMTLSIHIIQRIEELNLEIRNQNFEQKEDE